jgi:ribose 5-phosphate isomerase RpiB
MKQSDFNKLVEIIADGVRAALQAVPRTRNQTSEMSSQKPIVRFSKRLLTEADALSAVGKNVESVFVDKRTLITPLANDHFRQNRITIIRIEHNETASCGFEQHRPASRTIGLLAVNCSQTARDKVVQVSKEFGFDTVAIAARYATPSGIQSATLDTADRIAQGVLFAAVVIDETAFSLKLQANRIQGAIPAMCWDVAAKDYCPRSSKSNMLFVNHRLLGFRKLEQIMRIWLASFMDDEQ